MGITSEFDDLAIRVSKSDDITVISETLKTLFKRGYNKGYADGFSAKCKSIEAKRKSEELEFRRQMDIIDDVMSAPFDIDHQ